MDMQLRICPSISFPPSKSLSTVRRDGIERLVEFTGKGRQNNLKQHRVDDVIDSLVSKIALVDSFGVIIFANKAWRDFGSVNGGVGSALGVGVNYLAVCDRATGPDAAMAAAAAEGIRGVLGSSLEQYVAEYPCPSPSEDRWFRMVVTSCGGGESHSALIEHVDITEIWRLANALKSKEAAVKRLNRMLAALSNINGLIVRVRNRDELFRESCRIVVEQGGLSMALILQSDAETGVIGQAARFGMEDDYALALTEIVRSRVAATALGTSADQTPLVSNDAAHDPRLWLGREHEALGVGSLAAIPLSKAGRTTGLIVFVAAETNFFHDAELKLLAELSDDIAFAIDHIEKIERLDFLAYFDQLTGLANRSLFLERLADRLGCARKSAAKLCLIMIDVDHFKEINLAHGREAGDAILQQMAVWLVRYTGDASRIARVGADQFVVITRPFTDRDDLVSHLDEDTSALLDHQFLLDGNVFRLPVKAGLAIAPDDIDDAERLLNKAELALKRAKHTGQQRLFFERWMIEGVAGRLTLENQMRQALDKSQFVLNYQPIISLSTGRLTGVEALIRWNNPNGVMTPPGEFIPILEESGLILEVGRWVLRTAVEDYLRWRGDGLDAVRISVNVSPLQLRSPGFVADVLRIVSIDAKAAPGLELEITENVVMQDVRKSMATLEALRNIGVKVAIDDFGTGFSSLSQLAKLPVDTLKIDRSFIIDMVTGPRGLALVSTIINLGHSMGLSVLAEGVETEEQARLLGLLGCDEMQGYLESRPLTGAMFEARYLNKMSNDAA